MTGLFESDRLRLKEAIEQTEASLQPLLEMFVDSDFMEDIA